MQHNALTLPSLVLAVGLGASVAMVSTSEAQQADTRRDTRKARESFLSGRGDSKDMSLPSVYVIPMKGQMGTDVREEAYTDVIKNIKQVKPDLLVWELECADVDRLMLHLNDQREAGISTFLNDFRKLVATLQDELKEFRHVMWVKDAVGIGSVMAMAWPDMYMAPNARLVGMQVIWQERQNWQDLDIRAKMTAAAVANGNAFLQRGGYPLALGEAMMIPDRLLSANWKGRKVEWKLDNTGEYLVDGSDEHTASFTAKMCEDFCISKGTAAELDDLMLLYGYREYRVLDGEAPLLVEKYIQDWRRAYDQAQELVRDYQQHRGWATGEETVKWLGRARTDLERLVSLMKRFKAVEVRMGAEYGMSILGLEIEIEKIKETLQGIRSGRGGNTGTLGGAGGGRGGRGGQR